MPIWAPRNRASSSSLMRSMPAPGDAHRARIGRLQPGHGHQQGRFARTRRPQQREGLAFCDIETNILQDMRLGLAAAQCEIDIFDAYGGIGHEMTSGKAAMTTISSRRAPGRASAPYGRVRRFRQIFFRALAALALALTLAGAAPASARTLRIVALGDSLTAGYGLPADLAFPVVLAGGAASQGASTSRSSTAGSPATRPPGCWRGSTGRSATAPTARSSRSAPMTCCAASIPTRRGPNIDAILGAAARAQNSVPDRRHARGAQSGRSLCRAIRADLHGSSRRNTRRRSIPSSSTASPASSRQAIAGRPAPERRGRRDASSPASCRGHAWLDGLPRN